MKNSSPNEACLQVLERWAENGDKEPLSGALNDLNHHDMLPYLKGLRHLRELWVAGAQAVEVFYLRRPTCDHSHKGYPVLAQLAPTNFVSVRITTK